MIAMIVINGKKINTASETDKHFMNKHHVEKVNEILPSDRYLVHNIHVRNSNLEDIILYIIVNRM
jgi:hypothetical protein